jgi:hypothetical protein
LLTGLILPSGTIIGASGSNKSLFMKAIIVAALLSICAVFYADAQVNVNVNIGVQPLWGPVGYDYVEYYYLPDIEAYYWVPRHEFVYMDGGRWIFARNLPPRYKSYDLYGGYKVVVNEPKPYMHFEQDRVKYKPHTVVRQEIIRDSHDSKYYVIKGHPGNKGVIKTEKHSEPRGGHSEPHGGHGEPHGGRESHPGGGEHHGHGKGR